MTLSAVSRAFSSNVQQQTVASIRKEISKTQEQKSTLMQYSDIASLQRRNLLASYCDSISQLNNVDALEVSNKIVKSRLSTQASTITSLREKVIELRGMVQEFDRVTADVSMKGIAEQNLRQLALTLNGQNITGGYEFGGMTADIPPIEDIEAFIKTSNLLGDKPTSNYTKVIHDKRFSQIDLTRQVQISEIDAAHPAFQTMIGALHTMRMLENPQDHDAKVKVIDMFEKAFRLLQDLESSIVFDQLRLEDAEQSLAQVAKEVSITIEETFKANIPELIAAEQEQNIRLKTALLAVAKAKEISLLDFVR